MKHLDRLIPPQFDLKIRRLRRLQATIEAVLPGEFSDWVYVCDVEEGVLTLIVNRQAVAANLRFHTAKLEQAIQERHGILVKSTRVRIQHKPLREDKQKRNAPERTQNPSSARVQNEKKRLRKLLGRL